MPDMPLQKEWEKDSQEKFNAMIGRMPLFHRDIARQVVKKKAEENAQARRCDRVEEEDIVRAFFSEVPKAFYSLMIRLLDEVGFNYRQYESK
ncbi:MAG: DUF2621 family protein [Candidatus Omnitrophota bacterium]